MPKGYIIAQSRVTDPESFAKYVEGTKPAAEKHGMRPVARGGRSQVLEGRGHARVTVLEFDSYEDALAYYNSPEYQAAREHRLNAAEFDMVVVEGV
ncbi:MAG: DUF1330 domain-containing protein [Asticcacaulis sp.]|uniref:DUF1330 domain-containing protein n=1 Tax=Asticcacaulis tiandongensis TaxID=2565365 RepID=UPI00112ABF1D|nr:DUF1330 domain-containing protein [Asticcacaulis tiandongensis]